MNKQSGDGVWRDYEGLWTVGLGLKLDEYMTST